MSLHEDLQKASLCAQQRQAETALVREEFQRLSTVSSQTEREPEKVKAELKVASTALDQSEQVQDRIHSDLDAAVACITEYLANKQSAAPKDDANANAIKSLDSRLLAAESRISAVGNEVNSIATSRIWRSLLRGGGLIQKVLPSHHR